jgi:hypothetical protein
MVRGGTLRYWDGQRQCTAGKTKINNTSPGKLLDYRCLERMSIADTEAGMNVFFPRRNRVAILGFLGV